MSDNRQYLEKGTILHLHRENSKHTDDWEILDIIGEGGSSVCYAAQSGRKQGRLKEFNPVDRSVDAGSMNSFLAAYRTLESVKAKDVRYQVLNNYIPHYELLFSADKSGKYTGAYIWTPDDKLGTNFADYLSEVRHHPENMPEQTVANIIDVIYTLTDCICLLHSAGILHLDLKPSNFLVTYNSRMELNTGNISLFDINTITSIENDSMLSVGTDGYCAPEVDQGAADNRSDIYSIGAILFNALIIAEPVPDGIYRDEYYDSLDCLVSGSKLIRISAANSSVELRSKLTDILRKCLAYRPADRYDYCEQLMEDLLAARQLIDYKQPAGADIRPGILERVQKPQTLSGTNSSKMTFGKWIAVAAAIIVLIPVILFLGKGLNIGNTGRPGESSQDTENKDPAALTVSPAPESGQTADETGKTADETGRVDIVNGDAGDTGLSAADMFDNDKVARNLKQKILDLYNKGGNQEFVLSPDEAGSDVLTLVDGFKVYSGQKLVIPKEMSLLVPDGENITLCPGAEIVIESCESLNPAVRTMENVLLICCNNVKVTIGEVTFTTSGGDGWAMEGDNFLYLFKRMDWSKGEIKTRLMVAGDLYVSCDREEFTRLGFEYFFEGDDRAVDADSPLEGRAIFFAGSDEPYEIRLKEDPDSPRSVTRRWILGLNDMFYENSIRQISSEYILSPDEAGTDCLKIEPSICIHSGQKLTVPKEMKFICANWNMFDVQSGSELFIESSESIEMFEECEDPIAAMNDGSILTIDGVTFYMDGVDGWVTAYFCPVVDEAAGHFIQVSVIGDVHVSCDYETFISKGFKYRFEFDGQYCPPKFPLDRLAIFFDGSDEPYDVLAREDYD